MRNTWLQVLLSKALCVPPTVRSAHFSSLLIQLCPQGRDHAELPREVNLLMCSYQGHLWSKNVEVISLLDLMCVQYLRAPSTHCPAMTGSCWAGCKLRKSKFIHSYWGQVLGDCMRKADFTSRLPQTWLRRWGGREDFLLWELSPRVASLHWQA